MPHSASAEREERLAASGTPLRVFATADALGEYVAARLLERVEQARVEGRRFLLGCPTGRSPRPVFAAMARQLATRPRDVGHLVLVMMDEYLVPRDGALEWAPAEKVWSCHHFARVEIAQRLGVRDESIWFPHPHDPADYDGRIAAAGGIDLFLLASGASDGHVAFNPPGSPRDSLTRIIPLSEETRRDNLSTFPAFGTLDAVPHHGVSVGVATITASREAVMLAMGEGKRLTVERMRRAAGYEADWPATLIHECAAREIVCDVAAAG